MEMYVGDATALLRDAAGVWALAVKVGQMMAISKAAAVLMSFAIEIPPLKGLAQNPPLPGASL
jgi:hypothetical protein